MKANIKLLKKKRIYSEEFKRQIVKDFESGQFSVPQLEKLHNISNTSIYSWIHKFSTFNEKGSRVVEMKNSSAQKMKEQQARIKELEAIVGRKQIKIDYLEKLIDIAEDDLSIDIKKNSNTPQSTGSEHIKKH
ncbi:transposase [Winogradskyella schleiferi]|uniref:transposase n=1 Tax=Winogradskyella schleiferi TaxID=2686078 RepID=UPI0015BE60AD|nr:transposase [Winogradskyella schleiferi]